MDISDYRIEDHRIDGEQYFPGAGLALTPYTDISIGIGDSYNEALEDAAENLSEQWSAESVAALVAGESVSEKQNQSVTVESSDSETHYYVIIRCR